MVNMTHTGRERRVLECGGELVGHVMRKEFASVHVRAPCDWNCCIGKKISAVQCVRGV